MKKLILIGLIFCGLGISESYAQNYNNWAVGFRVGEPLGLNVRKYFDAGSKNFDLNVGTYGLLWGGHRDYKKSEYYAGHTGMMVQGLFHWNNQLGSTERLQVYYGFGGQINSRKTAPQVSNNVPEKHISLGGVGNAGIEYSLPTNDLSVFFDFGLYTEVAPKPLFMAVNSGVGVRLNINR